MISCKYCHDEIEFDDDVRSASGKCIPLDESREKHQCSDRAYSIRCRNCNVEIYFDEDHISKNGKKIPLSDDKPHIAHEEKVSYQLGSVLP